MVIHTTIATNGLKHEVTQSMFPSVFRNLNGQRPRWNCLRRMEFVINVEEYMESWKDRICPECQGGHIPSEESVNRGVLWHSGYQGSWCFNMLASWQGPRNGLTKEYPDPQAHGNKPSFMRVLYSPPHIPTGSKWIRSESAWNGRNLVGMPCQWEPTQIWLGLGMIPIKFRPVWVEWLGSARIPILPGS